MKSITFETACQLIAECDAIIFDGTGLSFPSFFTDDDKYIEIIFNTNDGIKEFKFTKEDKYFYFKNFREHSGMVIKDTNGESYHIKFLRGY